jgi:Carboxypeptidase regulatory-like domain
MKKFTKILMLGLVLAVCQIAIQAQTNGSISGIVTDQSGAIVPGATITVKGEAGQEFTAVTNDDGVYTIPGVPAGTPTYTVTISAPSFKKYVVTKVKVDVATPATVNAELEAGNVEETVTVASGGEVLQTETATVGTTITGRQILETPIQSRDALDLITTLPGTTTTGVVRTSSINGLPKSALTIQIDGVDVQDNFLKSSDGFFTFIRPRIDNIDEVTVSTATPGAESSGDGAVAIRFQTRRGTDDYRGSAFWQHRDEGLNAANFQNNYLNVAKSKLRLNQFGGSFGGPLPFPRFGQGGKAWDSGKGKAYFFVNYERFHLNENSPNRARNVMTTEAQNGIFRYGNNGVNTVNLFNIATGAGLPNTIDPTVQSMLNLIRAGTATTGAFQPVGTGGVFFRQPYNFSNPGQARRRFLVIRMDANLTKDHAIDGVYNDQPFRSNVDFLNNVDPAFPGIPNAGTQNSDRRSLSIGLRSSFGSNVVNQFRYAQLGGWLKGSSRFDLVGGTEFFTNLMNGYAVSLTAGLANPFLTSPTIRNAATSRTSPTMDFSNTLTWVKGNHTFAFGGQYKKIQTISDAFALVVPGITLGVAVGDTAVTNAFTNTGAGATLPGASDAERTNAQILYAILTGRISQYTANAILGGDGQYSLNGSRHFEIAENTNGLFAQDSWRIRPNLTLSYGVRWQPQTGAKMMTTNYSLLSDPNMLYDVSGAGNLFSPGTLTGTVPTVRGNAAGEKAFKDDLNNFAPSFGVVWAPDANGFMGRLIGRNGNGVFRGGFSRAFIREGTLIVENSVGQNPGGQFAVNRTAALGNLTIGTLFRTAGNPNLNAPAFTATPVFPRTLTAQDAAFGFSPDFHSGFVDSWSFGYQREIGRDTVIEFRYVGNRGKEMQHQYLINELNAVENGFGAEFALAQQNLLANIASGVPARAGSFAYFGPGTGTSPLPIMVSYLQAGNPNPNLTASYGANFASQTFVPLLSPANPNIIGATGFAATLANTATLRANGAAAGRPANFFHNCPTTLGFCFLFDNTEKSWFDAGVIEIRRRLSDGLRFQASYQYGKSYTNAFSAPTSFSAVVGTNDQSNVSNVTLRNRSLDKTFSQIDVRHAFKFDATWDLPLGRGRKFLSQSNGLVNSLLGGWTLTPTVRWQSGAPILMENVQLVGMTAKELQDAVGVYYNTTITQPNGATSIANVTYLPEDIIANTIRAFTTTGSTASGYAAGQAPTGRFLAPAGYGNCQQRSPGTCGFRKFVLYGPNFFKIDSSIGKRFNVGEKRSVELRMTVFDVLNHTNWRLGGWTNNVNNITVFTGTFGQMQNGWAFQDPNGSNDPGGRVMDFLLRINF